MKKQYACIYNTPEYRKKYTGLYGSWYAMKQRCNNPKHKQFKDYGGRGITFEPRWEFFNNFKEDMQDNYVYGLTIDRIDNSKGYSRDNCKWSTRKIQNRNKRCCHLIEFDGKRMTLPEWAEYFNINFGTLRSRFYRGMSLEKILTQKLYRPQKI